MNGGYSDIRSERLGRINRFRRTWRNGRQDRFPICCILRFAIPDALRDGQVIPFEKCDAVSRGSVRNHPRAKDSFVPCNIFHHKTHSFEEE